MKKLVFFLIALADALLVMVNFASAETAPQAAGSFSPYSTVVLKMSSEQIKPTAAFLEKINADSSPAEEETDTFAGKMGIGILNTVTSWTDIPRQVKDETQNSNVFSSNNANK